MPPCTPPSGIPGDGRGKVNSTCLLDHSLDHPPLSVACNRLSDIAPPRVSPSSNNRTSGQSKLAGDYWSNENLLIKSRLQDQHDHRLRPPAGVVVPRGSRSLSHTTRSQRREMEVRALPSPGKGQFRSCGTQFLTQTTSWSNSTG